MSQLSLLDLPKPRAVFSPCSQHMNCPEECKGRVYRYQLEWPTGAPGDRRVLFCLANPSTATHLEPDRTVTRCIGYSRDMGFAWCGIANARAWRETDPDLVPPGPRGVGPRNAEHVLEMVRRAELVICGWGKLGGTQGPVMLDLICSAGKTPHALSLNDDGSPEHPLYLKKTLRPFPIPARAP